MTIRDTFAKDLALRSAVGDAVTFLAELGDGKLMFHINDLGSRVLIDVYPAEDGVNVAELLDCPEFEAWWADSWNKGLIVESLGIKSR